MRRHLLSAFLLASIIAAPRAALADGNPAPLARHTCPDGLLVLVAETHATPLVTVEIAVHNGAMTESPEFSGLSHLYEHMFFKGNAVLTDQLAYMTRARELGLVWNGTTGNERVNYYFTTSSDHLADSMKFMHDAIVSPRFDAKELERERVVVTGEIDRNESDPNYFLWHTLEQRVFWKYPTRKDALGTRKSVLAASVEQMRTIQKRYYVPNNSVLVVTGDVKADDVFQQADALYADWKRADPPFKKYPTVKHPPIKASEVVLVAQPVENFNAMIDWQGPETANESVDDTYAADVLSTLVDDSGSRFQRALVDSGLCVNAFLGYETQRHTGEITISYEALPDKIDACTSALFAELPKLEAADAFTDEELKNAAHRIAVSHAHRRETTESWAHELTYFWSSATLEYGEHHAEKAAAVTRADIGRYLHAWVLGKPFVLAAMASQARLSGGLDKSRLERLAGIKGGSK